MSVMVIPKGVTLLSVHSLRTACLPSRKDRTESSREEKQCLVAMEVRGQMEEIRPVKFREEITCLDLMELYKATQAIMRSQGLLFAQ